MASNQTLIPSTKNDIFLVWFGPGKRINRREYWLMGFIPLLCINMAVGLIATISGFTALMVIGAIPTTVVWIMVNTKRWHDINKSGWWNLLLLIPLVGYVIFIWLGIARGNPDPNKYGPAPSGATTNEG